MEVCRMIFDQFDSRIEETKISSQDRILGSIVGQTDSIDNVMAKTQDQESTTLARSAFGVRPSPPCFQEGFEHPCHAV